MSNNFRPDREGFRKLSGSPEFRAAVLGVGGTVARHANQFARAAGAPWMKRPGQRQPVVAVQDDGRTYVVNTDHAGHLEEFGSKNNPPHAPLRRAVRAAGLPLTETPK